MYCSADYSGSHDLYLICTCLPGSIDVQLGSRPAGLMNTSGDLRDSMVHSSHAFCL